MSLWRRRVGPRLTGPPNPYQTAILFAAVLSGAVYATGLRPPTSLQLSLPEWLRMTWAVMLLAGGLLAFAGLFWPWSPFTAIVVKRAGLLLIAGGTSVYGVTVAAVLGPMGAWQVIWNLVIAVASVVRAVQITRILRDARRHAIHYDVVAARIRPDQPDMG